MTAYAVIANNQIDTASPVTQTLMTQMRDNPIAIAEGAAGAPINATGWHPYNAINVGDGFDGTFYDHATDGNVTSVTSPAFEDGYEYAVFLDGVTAAGSGDVIVQATVSGDTPDSLCYAIGTVIVFSSLSRVSKIRHDFTANGSFSLFNGSVTLSLTAAGPSAGPLDSFRILGSGGNLNAGTVKLLRRREFLTG